MGDSGPGLRVVVLTGDEPQHRFVANQLADSCNVVGVLVDVAPGPSLSDVARREWRSGTVVQFLSRVIRGLVLRLIGDGKRRNRVLSEQLGPLADAFGSELITHEVQGVHTPSAVAKVASWGPDVIAVYGTSIVRPAMLSQAREIALNLHTGVSPYYRGTDCEFWPIFKRQPHLIGVTVHECVTTVDGGDIYATAQAPPTNGDDIHKVFANCVQVGAVLYAETLRSIEDGTAKVISQDLSRGREYRMVMRGAWPEWIVRRRLRSGSLWARETTT